MNYKVYTDGACNAPKNKITSSYFIRTENKFIMQGSMRFKGNNIAIAETIALGLAVEALLKDGRLTKEDKVDIFTDSKSVVDFFDSIKTDNPVLASADPRVWVSWQKFIQLKEICEFQINKVHAHREGVNGNKVADRLAKYALRG